MEILENGDFENGLDNWLYAENPDKTLASHTGYSNYYTLISSTNPQHGSKCMYFPSNASGTWFMVQHRFNLTKATNLSISYYYKFLENPEYAGGCAVRNYTTGTTYKEVGTMSYHTNWTRVSNTVTLQAGQYYITTGLWHTAKGYIDNVSIMDLDNAGVVNGSLWALNTFEYGKNCTYYASLTNTRPSGSYCVDVYGVNNNSYKLLGTYNFTSSLGDGSYPIYFAAPASNSGYFKIYGVLRTPENNEMANSTDILITDKNDYFEFIPSVVGYNEPATLYYSYNYSGQFYSDSHPYRISEYYQYWMLDEQYIGRSYTTFPDNQWYTLVDGLSNNTVGSFVFNEGFNGSSFLGLDNNNHFDKNGNYIMYNYTIYRYYSLYRYNDYGQGNYERQSLRKAALVIDPDKKTPIAPHYIPNPTPEVQANDSENIPLPVTPDPYRPPDYPSPNHPGDDGGNVPDNGSGYNGDNGTWEYNNDTGQGDGYYPVDVPGNTSVDTSRFKGFETFVDNAYSPLNNSVNGFLNFVLSPVNTLTGYVTSVRDSFLNSTSGLIDTSLITDVFVPIMDGMPPLFWQIIIFSLCLTLIGLLLNGGRN